MFSFVQLGCSIASLILGLISFGMKDDYLRAIFVNFAVLIAQLSVVLSLVLFITGNVAFRRKAKKILQNMSCFRNLQVTTSAVEIKASHWSNKQQIEARSNAAGNDVKTERIGGRASFSYDSPAYHPDAEIDDPAIGDDQKASQM